MRAVFRVMLTNWKKRLAGAVVLAFGMLTTIATSQIEDSMTQEIDATREAGAAISVVAVADPASASVSRLDVSTWLESEEDPGLVRVIEDDGTVRELTVDLDEESGLYEARVYGGGIPNCVEGAELCDYVFTVEPQNPVTYRLFGDVALRVIGERFEEGAFFAADADQ